MDFIKNIILNSLFIWGVYSTFQEGMIFNKIGKWLQTLPKDIRKPLGTCPVCMSSIYGVPGYFILMDNYTIFGLISYITMIAGLNYVLLCLFPE